MQFIHGAVIIHVYGDLLVCFAMENCERRSNFDLIVVSCSKQSANNPMLSICAAEIVIKDGEQCYWVDRDICGGAPMKKKTSAPSIYWFLI